MNLSVPFANVVELATTKAVENTAAKIENPLKGINFKNWRTWVIITGALIVLYLLFKGIQTNPVPPPVPQLPELPDLPKEDPLKEAQKYHQLLEHTTSSEKIHYYILATQNYEKALYNIQPSTPEFGEVALQLGRLYGTGVPEHYDSVNEEKINGIPPDTDRAIMFYQQAISSGFHSAILELASIFHWGNVGFKPNREYAKHLYASVLKVGNEYEQGIARDRLRQMNEEEGKISGSAVLDGVEGVGNSFSGNNFNTTPFTEEFCGVFTGDNAPGKVGKDELTKDIDDNYVDEVMMNDLHIKSNRKDDSNGNVRGRGNPKTSFSTQVPNDLHNARDHIVMNTVRQSIEKLRASTHIQDDEHTTIKRLHQYIVKDCDLPDSKRQEALFVLKQITSGQQDSQPSTNTPARQEELEALKLVFNRINSRFRDKKERTKLLDNLVSELSECIEFGQLICSQGIVDRIVDSINFIDEAVKIKPKWALSREMLSRAAVLRKNMLTETRSEVKEALQSTKPTARQRMLSREFKEKLKTEIERDFMNTYVDAGIMTKDLLKTEMGKWIDEI